MKFEKIDFGVNLDPSERHLQKMTQAAIFQKELNFLMEKFNYELLELCNRQGIQIEDYERLVMTIGNNFKSVDIVIG